MPYSYKGNISFGLVYIPITLHNSVKSNEISFNLLDKKTMSRIKYKKTCIDCDNKEVKSENVVKGFEYEDGKYVIFEDEDFEKIKSKRDKNITIETFVPLEEVDPIYFNKPYYVNPSGAKSAFNLLLTAMEELNKVGIAKVVIGSKESLVLIRAKKGEMLLNTLFFDSEIADNPAEVIKNSVSDAELKMAKSIINSMTSSFEPEKYKDDYKERVEQAIKKKIKGEELKSPREKKTTLKSNNLMDLLNQTLKEVKKKK